MALTKKPTLDEALDFAETTPAKSKPKSGKVPAGDVRLTANINAELHLKLKIAAATRRVTMGEVIEELIENMGA